MKKLFLIFILALAFRVIGLGSTPYGFHSDEARVGWNARSIIDTGADDRGNRFALHYNTFGDYRPTGIFYITIPSILLFGNTEFATRFPSALIGALTIFPLFYLAKRITKNSTIAYTSAFFLAILPWHVFPSRGTSEVVISLFFTLYGLLYLFPDKQKNNRQLITALLFLLIPYFFYHSARLLVPFFVAAFIKYEWKYISSIRLKKQYASIAVILFFISVIFFLSPASRGRLSQVSISSNTEVKEKVLGSQSMSAFIYMKHFIQEYTTYLSSEFMIGESSKPMRYRIDGVGLITLPLFIFLLMGIVQIIRGKYSTLPLLLLIIAPLPAALTIEDSPNLHRAFFMIPFITIIAACGAEYLLKKRIGIYIVVFLALFISTLNLVFEYKSYKLVGQYRNEQDKELILYLNEVKTQYDLIYVTNEPDSPFPWYGFFNQVNTRDFNTAAIDRVNGDWRWENIVWTQNRCPAGEAFDTALKDKQNILVIDNGRCSDTGFERVHPTVEKVKEFIGVTRLPVYRVWRYNQKS